MAYPYDPLKRMAKGVKAVVEDPTDLDSYLRAAGYSDYALGQKQQAAKSGQARGLRPVKSLRERVK